MDRAYARAGSAGADAGAPGPTKSRDRTSAYPATQPTVHALARLQERVSRSAQGLADPPRPADDRR